MKVYIYCIYLMLLSRTKYKYYLMNSTGSFIMAVSHLSNDTEK